jgi:hypothetical protein
VDCHSEIKLRFNSSHGLYGNVIVPGYTDNIYCAVKYCTYIYVYIRACVHTVYTWVDQKVRILIHTDRQPMALRECFLL